MKKGRGLYEELKAIIENKVIYVKWYDNKVVNIVSTFVKAAPVYMVSHFDYKLVHKVEVPCSNIIKL